LQHRADAREGVNHRGDERPVAQAHQRACINGSDERAGFLAVEHRGFPFFL
jgi:hypothetical protein